MFRDRADAAARIAERLSHLRGTHPLVLAVPRGGVPMGAIVADALEGELDVVLVRKLGAPGNPEFAVGAIGEDGTVQLNEDVPPAALPPGYLERESDAQRETLRRRRRLYSPVHPPIDPAGRTVIVVDDGAATGSTLLAAVRVVRTRQPRRLVVALGVAPRDTLARLAEAADEVVSVETPRSFFAVGQFYRDFSPVSDNEVIEVLRAARTGGMPPAVN